MEANNDTSGNIPVVYCPDGAVHATETVLATPLVKKNAEGQYETDIPQTVFTSASAWISKYGLKGIAESAPLERPCIYPNVNYVFTKEWDQQFFRECLWANKEHYMATMNVAEKYGMTGFLDFMAIGLGCQLRNEMENENVIHKLMGIDSLEPINEDDLKKVSTDYPWFAEATKPVVKQ